MINMLKIMKLITITTLVSSTAAFTATKPNAFSAQVTSKSNVSRKMMDMSQFDVSAMSNMMQSSIFLADAAAGTAEVTSTYSKASYYTTLGLYVMSFPGIWSQIKRSTSAKVKRKTYISDGEAVDGGKDLRQQAGEIMACKLRIHLVFSIVIVCAIQAS